MRPKQHDEQINQLCDILRDLMAGKALTGWQRVRLSINQTDYPLAREATLLARAIGGYAKLQNGDYRGGARGIRAWLRMELFSVILDIVDGKTELHKINLAGIKAEPIK